MAESTGEDVRSEEKGGGGGVEEKKQRKKGLLSWIWRGIFGRMKNEDFEKKLQNLSKEEATVHARMKKRALWSRKIARNIILFSVFAEVAAIALTIVTVRSLYLNLRMKIVRSLPVILSPGLSFVTYTTVIRFTRMLDRKDQKTLERLRAERKAKLDELKELTNYYTTQQLIQRYDLDPAAKAAAASALASKLSTDSGLKVNESNTNIQSAKNNDVELAQSSGLRYRKERHLRSNSSGSSGIPESIGGALNEHKADGETDCTQSQMVVEHHRGSSTSDGGWIARIAALLVGEDPSQSCALICGNCLRHNGLARKEDFLQVTYYCPHCHALNTFQQPGEHDTTTHTSGTPSTRTSVDGSLDRSLSNASSASDTQVTNNIPSPPVEHSVGSKMNEDGMFCN